MSLKTTLIVGIGVFVGFTALGNASHHPGHVHGARAIGREMAARRGWTGPQWSCLDTLWAGESDWDKYNTYPAHDTPPSTPADAITTAYGIPQALPAQKMATAGANWQTSARTQIRWGLRYIHDEYGTPCAALNFKTTHGNRGY